MKTFLKIAAIILVVGFILIYSLCFNSPLGFFLSLYISIGLLFCAVCGVITERINKEKGYTSGFAWGFFLNIIGIIVVATRPFNMNDERFNSYLRRAPLRKEPDYSGSPNPNSQYNTARQFNRTEQYYPPQEQYDQPQQYRHRSRNDQYR